MSNLQLIQSVAKELRVDENGIGYISIRGAARVCGISHSTLVENLGGRIKVIKTSQTIAGNTTEGGRINSGVDFLTTKLGKKLAQNGFEGVDFFDGIPDVALAVIIEYYAFEANRITPEAQLMMRALAAVGVRSLIHQVTGWKAPVVKEPTMLDYAKALIAAHETIDNLQTSVDELVEENAVLLPKAHAYDFYFNAEGLTSIEEFAKTVCIPGVGRNKMFVLLRELMIIQKNSTLPYQRFIPRYFVVRPEVLPSGTTYNRAFLTKDGVQLLLERLQLI